jgi:hypothetical protein
MRGAQFARELVANVIGEFRKRRWQLFVKRHKDQRPTRGRASGSVL